MYFRMLKRDLTDKIGLNITLFIFMILASVFMVISTHLLYTSFVASEETYDYCKTSDIVLITDCSITDKEGSRAIITECLEGIPEFDCMYLNERMIYAGSMVSFMKDNGEKEHLSTSELMCATVQTEYDIPYNMDDELLSVPNGCVALPQNLLNNTEARVGDKIQITTQMGNIYEFIISDFYKDPSAYIYDRMLFSDDDYKVLYEESPVRKDVYEIYFNNIEGDYISCLNNIINVIFNDLKDTNAEIWSIKGKFSTNDGIIALIIGIVLSAIGVFMVGMIFMTIHFSLKSAIKREEKEIGIMKAIGVYSFSYKSLFAVKYIVFAVVGGIIGLPIAMVLGDILIDKFMIHIILPPQSMKIIMAIAAVVSMILIMVIFTFVSLRSMNKISVMDAIHGENKGERFRKIPGLFLHRKKRLNIPLFLASNDILGRVKRYGVLLFAYALGISMILLVIQIKDSVCSEHFIKKHYQINSMDFVMDIDETYYDKLYNKYGDHKAIIGEINKRFEENNIPAKSEYYSGQSVNFHFDGKEYLASMYFGDTDVKDLVYVDGGKAPILSNELAITYFVAKNAGIELGDTITIEYDKYKEDGISYEKVQEEFVVTAYIDATYQGVSILIMGEEFNSATIMGYMLYQNKLDCSNDMYQYYFERMDDLFADNEITFRKKDEAFDDFLPGYIDIFNLLLLVVSIVVAVVLTMITLLYENIFIEEETGDVAVLKSMGFNSNSVKLWHLVRMLLLVVISCVAAVILTTTLGNIIISKTVSSLICVYEFDIIINIFANFVIVPVSVTLLIVLCMLLILKAVNNIQIWRIRDE